MKVLILGANGLIGSAIARRLLGDGHRVAGLARAHRNGYATMPGVEWATADIACLTDAERWLPLLDGVDAVVNASGALQTGLRDRLEDVQYRAMLALYEACRRKKICFFVQISAPGAEEDAATPFLRTKGMADDALRRSGLKWLILKPGLVLAENAYGGTALLRLIAGFPLFVPLVHADRPVATASLDDVSMLVAQAIGGKVPWDREIGIAERTPKTLQAVVLAMRRWLGFAPPLRVVALPARVAGAVSSVADGLGWLGWRSPLRSTGLAVMANGIAGNADGFRAVAGRDPRSLEETLSMLPSTLQERWFARLAPAMPVTVFLLSLFWIVSGAIGLARVEAASVPLLPVMTPSLAMFCVLAGSVADIALGIAILFRPVARLACLGMIALSLFYLIGGTVAAPALWLDPLGAYVKAVPALALAWLAHALLEER